VNATVSDTRPDITFAENAVVERVRIANALMQIFSVESISVIPTRPGGRMHSMEYQVLGLFLKHSPEMKKKDKTTGSNTFDSR
jgi:hypothetical protein